MLFRSFSGGGKVSRLPGFSGGYMFGAPVFANNTVDWDASYEFNPDEEDVEYVAYMCKMLQDIKLLTKEHQTEVFVK